VVAHPARGGRSVCPSKMFTMAQPAKPQLLIVTVSNWKHRPAALGRTQPGCPGRSSLSCATSLRLTPASSTETQINGLRKNLARTQHIFCIIMQQYKTLRNWTESSHLNTKHSLKYPFYSCCGPTCLF
jgi:hypothetical protein